MKQKIIIFSLSFVGGIIGFLTFYAFFQEKYFFTRNQLDLTNKNNNQGLVINNPTNVIVEQNKKIQETINGVNINLFGIFKYKEALPAEFKGVKNSTLPKNLYSAERNEAVALPITSDGWIMSLYIPEELRLDKTAATATLEKIKKEYYLTKQDRQIFKVKDIIIDSQSRFSFWKIEASDLKVYPFAGDIKNGDMVLATNWQRQVFSANTKDVNGYRKMIMNSDDMPLTIALDKPVTSSFFSTFIFNINGEVIAFANEKGDVEMNNAITNCLNCLLLNKKIVAPSLGIKYLDLAKTANGTDDLDLLGVLILDFTTKENNSAQIAGLKKGDIILSVNGVKLGVDNDLRKIVATHKPGDELEIEYSRDSKRASIKTKLNEKK